MATLTPSRKDINVVFLGRSGAGKSSLIRTLSGSKEDPHSMSSHVSTRFSRQDVTFTVTDTVGLGETKEKDTRQLINLSGYTKGKADLLVYCISVDPMCKFDAADTAVLKLLQDIFGKDIWKQFLIVFTFSNTAWYNKKKIYSANEAIYQYRKHLQEFAFKFKNELEDLKVHIRVEVEVAYGISDEPLSSHHIGYTKITAIPAGLMADDKVLPSFTSTATTDTGRMVPKEINWRDVLFHEMIRKCDGHLKKDLLHYNYGNVVAKTVAKTVAGGAVGTAAGGVAGAGVGAVVGLVGGPIGMLVGFMVGAAAGATTGGAAVGGAVLKRQLKKVSRPGA
jgi:GTP-binding protein EngB required for normal cell division